MAETPKFIQGVYSFRGAGLGSSGSVVIDLGLVEL